MLTHTKMDLSLVTVGSDAHNQTLISNLTNFISTGGTLLPLTQDHDPAGRRIWEPQPEQREKLDRTWSHGSVQGRSTPPGIYIFSFVAANKKTDYRLRTFPSPEEPFGRFCSSIYFNFSSLRPPPLLLVGPFVRGVPPQNQRKA